MSKMLYTNKTPKYFAINISLFRRLFFTAARQDAPRNPHFFGTAPHISRAACGGISQNAAPAFIAKHYGTLLFIWRFL